MVILTHILGYASKLTRKYKRGFIDNLRIHVSGGPGGSGIPRYGGLGGQGGNVYLVATENLSLQQVKQQIKDVKLKAEAGGNSTNRGIIGPPGRDLNIKVPVGISVYDENCVKLGQVNLKNEKLLVARGGIGGCESTAYCGLKGESRAVRLDLQLIADVGLVGFPNAGKSTCLRMLSNAKPKIANYPFTTIKPQIGMINYNDHREISVADLPGLIEGAHVNRGMGYRFLKHVQRTKLLLFIVDIGGFQLSPKHEQRSCLETVLILNKEIELYKPDLLDKPAMIIVNKMDTKGANEMYKEVEEKLDNLSKVALDYDETMQPTKILQFDSILPAALILKNANEIQRIKERIRTIIDKYEEAQTFVQDDETNEDRLRKKLQQQFQRHAPTLI